MGKPKKLTEGHSSGPQAYWDSISGANKDAEIERLQEENERLRKLLKDCQPYIEDSGDGMGELYAVIDELLCESVEREVSDG